MDTRQEAWVAELGKVTSRRKIDREVSLLTVSVRKNSYGAPAGHYVVEAFHEDNWRVLDGPFATKGEAAKAVGRVVGEQGPRPFRRSGR